MWGVEGGEGVGTGESEEVGGSNVGGADYVTGWQRRDERERTGDSEELEEECVERSNDDESEEEGRVEKEVHGVGDDGSSSIASDSDDSGIGSASIGISAGLLARAAELLGG